MLIRYKKTYEKIAMGLLSYMPKDRTAKELLQFIHTYENDEDWQLFLWKDGDTVIGLIGGEQVGEHTFVIHHLSVNPSYRCEGIGRSILVAFQKVFPAFELVGTPETSTFVERFCLEEES